MTEADDTTTGLADHLMADPDFLSEGGEVDLTFWSVHLEVSESELVEALRVLAARGDVVERVCWSCPACGARSLEGIDTCPVCTRAMDGTEPRMPVFERPAPPPRRYPAALFLVHGMNTLGAWQESLSWKVSLLYGYSVPVFVFKYGWDLVSPWRIRAQRRRTDELAAAIRKAQEELARSGRSERCDVVAHSFGTLLVARLLAAPAHREIILGKVILTGSIVARDFPWGRILEEGRVEAVLNHRAGRDVWVRLAPWGFPRAGATGFHGFQEAAVVEDLHSPAFTHSDYFTSSHFDQVVKERWKPFLGTQGTAVPQGARPDPLPPFGTGRRYWVGRLAVGVVVSALIWGLLHAMALAGHVAGWLLERSPI